MMLPFTVLVTKANESVRFNFVSFVATFPDTGTFTKVKLKSLMAVGAGETVTGTFICVQIPESGSQTLTQIESVPT